MLDQLRAAYEAAVHADTQAPTAWIRALRRAAWDAYARALPGA